MDRAAVAATVQVRVAGSRLYRDVYAYSSRDEMPLITCEFDIEPSNPASERFHARLGFRELAGGSSTAAARPSRCRRWMLSRAVHCRAARCRVMVQPPRCAAFRRFFSGARRRSPWRG
jgi:predicted GNAT superfamily acetyltransferase